jgi:hypothetical protein
VKAEALQLQPPTTRGGEVTPLAPRNRDRAGQHGGWIRGGRLPLPTKAELGGMAQVARAGLLPYSQRTEASQGFMCRSGADAD